MTPSILVLFVAGYVFAAKIAAGWLFAARWARRQRQLGFPCGADTLRYRLARRVLALGPTVNPVAALTMVPPVAVVMFLACFALGCCALIAETSDRMFGTALNVSVDRRIEGLARIHLWLAIPPA